MAKKFKKFQKKENLANKIPEIILSSHFLLHNNNNNNNNK
jgi:hypothetical protein